MRNGFYMLADLAVIIELAISKTQMESLNNAVIFAQIADT